MKSKRYGGRFLKLLAMEREGVEYRTLSGFRSLDMMGGEPMPVGRSSPRTIAFAALLVASSMFGQGMIGGNSVAVPRPPLSGRPFPVSLVDVARSAGLRKPLSYGAEDRKKYIVEANGAGVALLDYNEDGLLDILLVNGSRLEKGDTPPPTNMLYRNDGHGTFSETTGEAGVNSSGWGNGVCVADVDNDGHDDLYLTYWGSNILYRSNGDGTFTDIAAKAGVAGDGKTWSTGCTFLDYDRDGYADLFVTSYVNFSMDTTPLAGQYPFCMWKGTAVYCGPRGLPFGTSFLYRNEGNGTFKDVSVKAGIRQAKDYYGFTAMAADLNGDGWTDIIVACDSTPSLFFRNNKDGTFSELGAESGMAYNEHGAEQAGMGLSIADFDNDGRLDILKTNFTGDYPNLFRNAGKGSFEDVVVKAGLGVNPNNVLWGGGFVDLDNDGLKDVFQVSGHVYPEVGRIDKREAYKMPRLVYRNLGKGKFEDMSARAGPAVGEAHSSRGAAFGDIDNDGDMDVVVMNMNELPSLLRNELKSDNRWVKVKLEGTKSNRSALGAAVTVSAGGLMQTDSVQSQSSFLSRNDPRLHFGLGSADGVDKFEVRWPSGTSEVFPGCAARQQVLLVEGTGQTKVLPLPQ